MCCISSMTFPSANCCATCIAGPRILMVIAVWLHMFRVFLTGSYKKPREFNWNIGVLLLVFTLLLSFTGLPAS